MFRYFEHIDEEADRFVFWEIAIEGPALELRFGPVGTAGIHEVEMCASAETAREEYERRIAAQLAGGFRECADRRLDERTRALEAAIDAEPADDMSYLVYADWIQTLGDPRGGLIVAQHAAATDPAFAERANAYLAQHAALFLGPLAEHVGYDGSLLDLRWHCGFIQAARLAARAWHRAPELVLQQLLDHGSARWLAELAVDHLGEVDTIQRIIDALAVIRAPTVRTLVIGEVGRPQNDNDWDRWEYGHANLSRLWRAFPNVRHLVVRGDPESLGKLELPALEHLALETRVVTQHDATAIANTAAPLARLDVNYYRVIEPRSCAEQLRPILESSLGRRLEHLSVTSATGSDELCRVLAAIHRPSLRELDLSHGSMTDDGAEQLAGGQLALEIVDVTRNLLTPRGIAALERIAKLVIAERQAR